MMVFHALGAAPAVVLTAPNGRAAVAHYHVWEEKLFGSPPRYEGYYYEIRGRDGKPYVEGSESFLTAVSQQWINPSFGG